MENILGVTDFIKLLATKDLGKSLIYYVAEGDTYDVTARKLTSIATRHKVRISLSKVLLVQEGKLAVQACCVTKK